MNERIRELAEQAGCSIDGMGYGEGNIEGLAELLVRECSKIAQQYDGNKLGGPGTVIAARIETHFGVEE